MLVCTTIDYFDTLITNLNLCVNFLLKYTICADKHLSSRQTIYILYGPIIFENLFSLCLSIGVGILWVYLLLKDSPHPIVFWTYLWISGASILFNALFYVGLMLALNRRKREPLNNQLFIRIYTPASKSILWESRVVFNEGKYCLARYHDDSKTYYDLIPLSDEASDYIKSVISESGYSFDYEYKNPYPH